jgi:uncharacterized damage-inducible protein DinB
MRVAVNVTRKTIGEPMQRLLRILLICLLVPTGVVLAQDDPPSAAGASQENPLTTHNKFVYGTLQKILTRAVEQVPEEHYGFKPTEAVRSFGQIVGHMADAQYFFCSTALGEENPAPQVEKTRTSKADLIAGLEGAFAYCDTAYDGMTDASAAQMVKLMGSDAPRLGVLTVNQVHVIEHYGNLVTYMRMKDIVPPTSDPEFMRQLQP